MYILECQVKCKLTSATEHPSVFFFVKLQIYVAMPILSLTMFHIRFTPGSNKTENPAQNSLNVVIFSVWCKAATSIARSHVTEDKLRARSADKCSTVKSV